MAAFVAGKRFRDADLLTALELKIEQMVTAISNCSNALETRISIVRRECLKGYYSELKCDGLTEQDDQLCRDGIALALRSPTKKELKWAASVAAAAEPPVRTSALGSEPAAAEEPAPKRRWAVQQACLDSDPLDSGLLTNR